MKRKQVKSAEDKKSFSCPVCNRPISNRAPCAEQTYVCYSCGAVLKVKAREIRDVSPIWWFLPPIFDILYLVIFGFMSFKVTEVSVVKNADSDFQPTLEWQAFVETRKSAEAGDAISQFKMGREHESGYGTGNEIEALEWYRKSADQGHVPAQQALGRMYFMGQGTARDYAESYFWYYVAEKNGEDREWSESVGRYLSAKQIAALQERAAGWQPVKIIQAS